MSEIKQIHIRVDVTDIAEYGYEAEELMGDKKKANAMIIAEIKRGAKARREKRLGVKTVSE